MYIKNLERNNKTDERIEETYHEKLIKSKQQ